eukprot:7383768-Prymnesium_polylepis.2
MASGCWLAPSAVEENEPALLVAPLSRQLFLSNRPSPPEPRRLSRVTKLRRRCATVQVGGKISVFALWIRSSTVRTKASSATISRLAYTSA